MTAQAWPTPAAVARSAPVAEARHRREAALFTVRDADNLTRRYVLRARHQPDVVLGTLLFPVLFVVLFGYVFGSSISVAGGDYRSYLMAGLFAQAQLYAASSVAVAVNTDMSEGVVDRFRALPIARSAVLLGRTRSALVVGLPAFAVMVGCALIVGWRPDAGVLDVAAAFALLLLFGQACAGIGAFIGVRARSTQSAEAVATLPSFLLGFVSNVFVDPSSLPGPLRVAAEWNPLSAVVTAARQLFGNAAVAVDHGVWSLDHPVAAGLIYIALLLLVVLVPLALRHYSRPSR